MAKFIVEITLGNDAMMTGEDIADALRDVSATVRSFEAPHRLDGRVPIRDINGNTVGSWRISK